MSNSRRAKRIYTIAAMLTSSALASPALAQLTPPAPVRQSIDSNGVDLFLGTINLKTPSLTIGQAEPQGLDYHQLWQGSGWNDNVTAALNLSGSTMTVSLGGYTDRFTKSGSTYSPTEANGATLTFSSGSNNYTYTRADGTVVTFSKSFRTDTPYYSNEGRVTQVVRPSGAKLTYTYTSMPYCFSFKPGGGGYICMVTGTAYRINKIRNNYGYQLSINYGPYEYEYDPASPEYQPDFYAWAEVAGATVTNLAVASGASTPSLSLSYANPGYFEVTDPMSRVTKYRYASGRIAGVTLPGSGTENMVFGYTSGRVTSVMTPAGSTTYSASDASGVRTVTVTDPLSHVTTYKFNIASERMTEVTDANGHTTTMQYDGTGRLTRATKPEGNYVQLTYDGRGNVTERRAVAKSGSGLSDIVTTAGYDASCSNSKTCNQPNWTKDAKNNQSDYTYDSGHGGVLTVTAPAPTGGGTRPQTRYSYTSLQAYFKVSGSSIVASGEPVILLTGTSTCQAGTSPSCVGTSDEVKTTVGYGPQTTGTGNNLLPVSTSQGAGDNSLTATIATTYDDIGNPIYVDGPLTGSADTTRILYNANRQTIGSIGPDPDGGSSLPNRAVRFTISTTTGLTTKQERGTTAGQTDPAWAAFSPAEAIDIGYDSSRRVLTSKLSSSGADYALTQITYDAASRVECVATRMNPAIYGSLPSDACTLGTTGSFGPDRIRKTLYDNANQVTGSQVAVGTTDAATEATLTYTNNGKLATLKDGEANLTTYEYDGFDRLSKTRYPLPVQGSNASSTTDYEQLIFDLNSNVTSRRLRDSQLIQASYDNLDRPTVKDLPGSEPDVSFTYDNLSRLTGASQTGNALSFTYDALGRNLTQVGPQGTVTSQWDVAGRRTKLTYPGSGLYIDYDYLVTGEMTKVRENGATSGVGVLATYGYDSLGRRSSLTFGNGVVQSYGFDPVSRLASLTNELSGTANDLSATFAYNPASQTTSAVRTGDTYAWTNHFNTNVTGVANGLNQLTSVGPKNLTHDARGNVTAFGTKSYTYSSENLLLTGPGSTTLSYDPGMRLYQSVSGGTTLRLTYDGLDRIAEYDGSNVLQRRYVHGQSLDEPLVWYEGSGTTDRRFLSSDERGSIISLTDGSGALIGINRYDEYGNPQSTNLGAFGYTGQAWLSGINLWYYKARHYDPELGRFLQTDPIDVEGGINLYAYVGNDPINLTDALGYGATEPPPIVVKCDAECQFQRALKDHQLQSFLEGKDGVRLTNPTDLNEPTEGDVDQTVKGAVNCGLHPEDERCGDKIAQLGPWLRPFHPHLMLPHDPQIVFCACFEAGTPVSTPAGLRMIEDIAIGDLVISEDPGTGQLAAKQVTGLIRPAPKPIYELKLRDVSGGIEVFRVTADHRWKVSERGWVATIDLTPGNLIETGSKARLTMLSISPTDQVNHTYNLTVADWHTFMVGHNQAIVHNDDWHYCPNTMQEQMAMEAASRGAGVKLPIKIGDPRFKGMDKWQYVVKSKSGITTTVHYIKDPATGATMDIKVKSTGP